MQRLKKGTSGKKRNARQRQHRLGEGGNDGAADRRGSRDAVKENKDLSYKVSQRDTELTGRGRESMCSK